MNVQKDFEELFALFREQAVEFLIVGGYAVAFHSRPRYTKDIDLLVGTNRQNAERLVAALAAFGFSSIDLSADDFVKPGQIIQLGVPPNRIDLLTTIDGVDWDAAWSSRCAGRYGGAEVYYIGRAELIEAKQAAARPQDLVDIATLKKHEPEK